MGEEHWKEVYSRTIMQDLNLNQTLQIDLNCMLENEVTESEEFEENFSDLSKLLKEFNFVVEYDESTEKFKTNLNQKETIAAENVKLKETISQLQSEIRQLKNSEKSKNQQIKNLQNDLELEKLFQTPTKDEEKKVIEQFQNSRNISHNTPPYRIKVKLQYFFLIFFAIQNFFREL